MKNKISFISVTSLALIIFGIYLLMNYWNMNTAPNDVHNIGLLNEKQNGIILSLGLILIAVNLLSFGTLNSYLPYVVYVADERKKEEYMKQQEQQEHEKITEKKEWEIQQKVNLINNYLFKGDNINAELTAKEFKIYLSESLDEKDKLKHKEVIESNDLLLQKLCGSQAS